MTSPSMKEIRQAWLASSTETAEVAGEQFDQALREHDAEVSRLAEQSRMLTTVEAILALEECTIFETANGQRLEMVEKKFYENGVERPYDSVRAHWLPARIIAHPYKRGR